MEGSKNDWRKIGFGRRGRIYSYGKKIELSMTTR